MRLHEHISDIKKNTGSPTVITDHHINFDIILDGMK